MSEKPTVTVGKLIVALQSLPQDLPVQVEGCDCFGTCGGAEEVQLEHPGKFMPEPHHFVLIKRSGR